jgi:hypothetical protein
MKFLEARFSLPRRHCGKCATAHQAMCGILVGAVFRLPASVRDLRAWRPKPAFGPNPNHGPAAMKLVCKRAWLASSFDAGAGLRGGRQAYGDPITARCTLTDVSGNGGRPMSASGQSATWPAGERMSGKEPEPDPRGPIWFVALVPGGDISIAVLLQVLTARSAY